jgi:LysM repeat protein
MKFRARMVGLLATLLLLGLLVGLPAALLALGANPIPHALPTLEQIRTALSTPDDGTLALGAIKIIAWTAWAFLAASILFEVAARIRGVRTPHLPGLRVPQLAARQLISAAVLLFVVAPAGVQSATTTTPAAHTASVAATSAGPTHATGAARPAGAAAAHTSSRGATATYTVKTGDSLRSIAGHHLGNPERWSAILALNPDLLGHPDLIYPGTVLAMPAAIGSSAGAVAGHAYTVHKGDTLSGIAQRELGNADAYPAIFQASSDTLQPGGAHLRDPDVIDVGWTLTIPAATVTPPAPAPAVPVSPTPPAAAGQPSGGSAQIPSSHRPDRDVKPGSTDSTSQAHAPARASATQIVTDEQGEHQQAPWMLEGLTGAGAMLAGSMLLALRRRRRNQFRSRRPGRTIAAPQMLLAPVEKTLTAVGTTTAPTVEHMDQLLRRLAARAGRDGTAMPELGAVELTAGAIVLHLSKPAQLPAPWSGRSDQMHWSIPPCEDLQRLGPANPDQPAPYPLLVVIGVSDQDHLWLLNLEDLDVTITGDPTYGRDVARHLAAEIACNPWSAGVRVDCVGVGEEVAPMHPGRIRVHGAEVVAEALTDAVATIDRTRSLDLDVITARASQAGADTWPARLLLIDAGNDPAALSQLLTLVHEHAGRTGTSVVVAGSRPDTPGVTLHVTGDGRLCMREAGLDLIAVGLTSDEAAGCASLLAQSEDLHDAPIPADPDATDGWRAWSNNAGSLRPEHTLPRDAEPADPTQEASSLLEDEDEAYLEVAATTSEDLATLAPRVTSSVRQQVEDADPTLDADVAAWFSDNCPLPRLSLLGPVRARTRGTPLTKGKPYMTEILAYLATRPGGVTPGELADTFNITAGKAREYARIVREWLGTDPLTGDRHLPDARQAPAAIDRGVGVYQVLNVLVDADLFRRLRVRGEARGGDGINDLRTALRLVQGRPFDRLRRGGWGWLLEGDRLDEHMVCAVVDVAHLLTTHSLKAGNLPLARLAAETAALAAPYEEIPRLDLAAVAGAEGHHSEAERILRDEVCNRTDDEGPPELPERTEQILQAKNWLGARAS